MHETSRDEFPIAIATMPASDRQRKIAFGALVVLFAVIAITIPIANIQLTRVNAFVPVIQTVMCLADLLAAVLLFAQYSVYPERAVLALASGYVFSGLFAFLQTLAFPGAYASGALIGDEVNSAGWLFVCWHTTFPLAVIAYTLLKDNAGPPYHWGLSTNATIGVAVACVVVVTTALTFIATAGARYLPSLYVSVTHQVPSTNYINVYLSLLSATTLVLLFVRKHTILDHWLIVTLLAWLPNFIVAVLFTVVRFTVGWYVARLYALGAGSALLFVLLTETVMLYARVAEAARIGAKQQRELSAAMVALEQVNLRFDTALKNMTHGLSMFDKDQRLILCNAHYCEMYGLTPEQTKPGTPLRSVLNACVPFRSSDIEIDADIEQRVRAISNSDPMYAEYKLHDGRVIAMNLQPMLDGGSVAIHQDITERKRAEDHQELLLSELDHRVKNILACVAVVAKCTLDGDRPMNELIQALDRRIQSMADAHTLLSQNHWRGVSLADLVRRQLAPYATETNIVISGPDITLQAAPMQALAMVLQELVTNALKYGSLSTPHGKVSVNWDRGDDRDEVARVVIAWRETGGPPTKAPSRSSYGTSLIRDLIPYELGGTVDLVFAPAGLHCDIEIPVSLVRIAN